MFNRANGYISDSEVQYSGQIQLPISKKKENEFELLRNF